jgi:hypothetical protein
MKLLGHYYKDEKFWLAEIPFIQFMDQGRSKKEVLELTRVAIESLINIPSFRCGITDLGDGRFTVASDDVRILAAFVIKRLREAEGLTIREAATRLKMKSHTEYARHESGKVAMTMATFNKYVEVLSSKEIILQIA